MDPKTSIVVHTSYPVARLRSNAISNVQPCRAARQTESEPGGLLDITGYDPASVFEGPLVVLVDCGGLRAVACPLPRESHLWRKKSSLEGQPVGKLHN
jgi:hypothetical protein